MNSGTRVKYNNKLGFVRFSILEPTGIIYNDISFDDGTTKTNVYDDELEIIEDVRQ